MSNKNKICIIVPAKGNPSTLISCIESLINLDYRPFEISIVDDGLSADSVKLLERFAGRINILHSDSRGPSSARNMAVYNTDVPFVAFTDCDCIVDKQWLFELARGFQEFPQAAACGGIQEIPEDTGQFEKKVNLLMQKASCVTDYMRSPNTDKITEVKHNASCCAMYKRDVFLKEKGFSEGLWPGEDVEFDCRLRKKGYKIFCNPKAVVYHYRTKDRAAFNSMMFRYGRAQGILVRKYNILRTIHIVPLLSLFMIALFILSLQFNFSLLYLIVITALGLSLWAYLRFDWRMLELAFKGAIYWNCGFFKGLISNRAGYGI
ncbi:MAG: glycosyltransferase [Candidatus Omnitrophota bacterium]